MLNIRDAARPKNNHTLKLGLERILLKYWIKLKYENSKQSKCGITLQKHTPYIFIEENSYEC